jgi:hypothetical protein
VKIVDAYIHFPIRLYGVVLILNGNFAFIIFIIIIIGLQMGCQPSGIVYNTAQQYNTHSIQFNSIQFINMLTLQPEGQLQSEHGAETENT